MVDAEGLVSKLRVAFASGVTRSLAWRKEQLAAMGRMLVDAEEELIEALRSDLGRPRVEAFGADIGHAKAEVSYLARHVEKWMRPKRVMLPAAAMPGKGHVVAEPLGVALVIAPWNYPIQLLLEPMAAAIAAGNCVVGKPSEVAPACSDAMARLVPQYLDTSAIAIVEGGVPETTELLEAKWDHIFFTGSTTVGRVVAEAAAKHLTPTTLELGGKSPTYVHSSADIEVAARRIAWGKFLNAGQTCIAPDYVIVDRSVKDELVDGLRRQVAKFYGDDPSTSASFGRIVNQRHLVRLVDLLREGAGSIVAGGDASVDKRYLAPTITVDPDPEGPLMTEEIFGPILPVIAVDGPDAAVSFVTDRPKPLAMYVFTGEGSVADMLIERTSAGGTCVNHTLMHLVPATLPFGGVGDSGWGAYHGKAGFDRFSHHRSVLRKPQKPDPRFLYPPYGKIAERVFRVMFR